MSTVSSEERLREIIGGPSALVAAKVADRLNDLTRQFVERSPFVCVATSQRRAAASTSPPAATRPASSGSSTTAGS